MAPKYRAISEILEQEIITNYYSPSNKLLTEEEYTKRFGVSRSTIRKAIELLVNKGYVYQVQGSGAFVRNRNQNDVINLENLHGLTADFRERCIETKVVEFELITANEEIAEKMHTHIGTPVYYVKRVRYIDGHTFSVEYSYFKKAIVPYLDEHIAAKSIFTYIREDLKLSIGFSDRLISADFLEEDEATLLQLPTNSPALVIENIVRLSNGQIFDVSKSIHNYKHVKLLKISNVKG